MIVEKKFVDQLAFCQVFQKFLRGYYITNLMNLWKQKFLNFSLAFEKITIQYALLRMIKNWKTRLNKRNKIWVIIMDVSKAFNTLNPNLLVAKLNGYRLDLNAASFVKSYLTNRYHTNIANLGTRLVNGKEL